MQQGFSIVEVILAVSLFTIIAVGSISSILYGENAQINAGERKRAALVADGTVEVMRAVRDSTSHGFESLSDGTYGLGKDDNDVWTLIPDTPDTVDTFLRSVTIGTILPSIKQIITNICWPADNCTDSVSLVTYLTNWRGNEGTPGGIRVAVSGEGHAYMLTTNNTLEVYELSNPAAPTRVGVITLPGGSGTLPVDLFYSEGQVYIASDDSSAELQIVDVSNPASPTVSGTLNVAVLGDDDSTADGVWADTSGYVFLLARDSAGTTSQFFMIDATDPTSATVTLEGETYTTGDAQTPGGITAGSMGATLVEQHTMCTTAGGSTDSGYKLHCYQYDFSVAPYDTPPSYVEIGNVSDGGLSPSRTVAIADQKIISTPGGQILVTGGSPATISENDIYDISPVVRSGRLYAYLSVVGDLTSGLKEVDITDNPVVVSARDTDGTFSGVAYDESTSPEYLFGANRTGSTLGFVSFAPTPVGLTITPFTDLSATTTQGAGLVHCDPTVSPEDDHGCPTEYTITNVTGDSIDYEISATESWVSLSSSGGTLAGGGSDTLTVSVDVDVVNALGLEEGTHTATLHLTYTGGDGNHADITRTVTLTILPANGIKVRSQ